MLKSWSRAARTQVRPRYTDTSATVASVCHEVVGGGQEWYPPVMLGASALAREVCRVEYVAAARRLLETLTPDDYARYMIDYYADGEQRFAGRWVYADIVTVLIGLSRILQPARYLEIGVRRGRSACAVASEAPMCDMALFDMWIPAYAGMDNPGPDLVRSELDRVGHRGEREFIDGDSHVTLSRYFAGHPGKTFDLITVDGDHADAGAWRDLCDVLPRLAIGGVVVFDDVCHPLHPGLRDVWRRLVVDDHRFSAWTFDEVGYGVGFAIRKW